MPNNLHIWLHDYFSILLPAVADAVEHEYWYDDCDQVEQPNAEVAAAEFAAEVIGA